MRSEGIAAPARLASVVVPLVIGLVLAVLVVLDQRGHARTAAESSVRDEVAMSVSKVRTELRTELAGAALSQAVTTIPAGDLAHASISTDAAIIARDSGQATLDDTARPPSIISPVYRAGAPVATTAQRRSAIESYRAVPLDLGPALSQLQPDQGGLVVRGPNRIVASVPSPAPSGALSYGVDMDITGSPGWVVQAWLPPPGVPGAAWLWALLVVALFAGMAALIAVAQQRAYAAQTRLRGMERNRTIVTGLAPVVQGSLDLGEVAPAVAAHLSDGLDLAGLSLSTPGTAGERQLFVWGSTPDPAVRPLPTTPDGLATGATFALSLSRGGRTLGVLRVVAGTPLERDQLVALVTASEMIGSALANAESFARQQELVERMRSVDELKTVFLATASHELRTPVTAIVGFSSLLLERWDMMGPQQQRGLLERIASNGQRLSALIEQLLDFSQLERGLPSPNDELLELGTTVRRILTDQPELHAGHELVVDTAAPCPVRGSSAAVERVVTNLVGNAAKYSPSGTTITVTVRADGERVELLVDDEGSGVPAEDRERVFSRFYRGRGDSVTRTRGAGIGLAIVAEYAASMSGRVSVGDAPAGGARFRVSFPRVAGVTAVASEGEVDVAVP